MDSYDFDARTNRFKHDLFSTYIHDAIKSQLDQITQRGGEAAAFAKLIRGGLTAQVECPLAGTSLATVSVHSPDLQYIHIHAEAAYPAVVVEVADSQPWKEVEDRAESYLLDSYVQAVVAFKFDYGTRATRKASISIWRLHVEGEVVRVIADVKQEAFRDEEGNPTHSAGLRLALSDFASGELLGDADLDIRIDTNQLCQMLTEVEHLASLRKQGSSVNRFNGLRKVRRERTPPESIASDEEESKRAEAGDPDWKP
jgi:hypothetical protein